MTRTQIQRKIDRLAQAFLFCASAASRPDGSAPQPEAWIAILPALRMQRLRPLAHWTARRMGWSPPPAVAEELEGAFYGASLRHEQLRGAAREIGETFATHGISALLLKGLTLADTAYPHPACRPMEDIDLLVGPDRLADAGRLLISLGYSDKKFGIEDFRNPTSGVVVDLHAELLNTSRLPIRRKAWQPDLVAWRKRTVPIPGVPHLRRLALDDQLAYLSHHAWLHHGLRKTLGLLDICFLFREICADRGETRLFARSDAESIRRGLWYALLTCNVRLGLWISPQLIQALPPAKVRVWERLLHCAAVHGYLPETARYAYLWAALGTSGRLAFFRQIVAGTTFSMDPQTGAQRAEGYQLQ
jgi:hypothetical protein